MTRYYIIIRMIAATKSDYLIIYKYQAVYAITIQITTNKLEKYSQLAILSVVEILFEIKMSDYFFFRKTEK